MKKTPPPRPLSQLYGLVLKYHTMTIFNTVGICNTINNMWYVKAINETELSLLHKDFMANDPLSNRFNFRYWLFIIHPAFDGVVYWWEKTKRGEQQRIKFIMFLVQKHQKAEAIAKDRYTAAPGLAIMINKLFKAIKIFSASTKD